MSAWTCRHTDGKVVQKIVPPRPRIPWWKGPGADSEEKQEPASDIDTALVDSLKVLDPKGPIREADIRRCDSMSAFKSAAPPAQVDISTLDEQPGANLDIGRRQFVQVQRVGRLLHAGTLT